MSLGYMLKCKKQYEDFAKVQYAYCIINLDEENSAEQALQYDGMLQINKDCLQPAQVRSKVVLQPNGKRELVQSRILHEPKIEKYLNNKNIEILTIAKNEIFEIENPETPYLTSVLLEKLFIHYQEKGELVNELEFI